MYVHIYLILESNLRVMDCYLSKLHVKVKNVVQCTSKVYIKSLQILAKHTDLHSLDTFNSQYTGYIGMLYI